MPKSVKERLKVLEIDYKKNKFLKLMNHMIDNKVILKLGYDSAEFSYALTDGQYSELIKEICGPTCDFCLDEKEEVIMIVEHDSHSIFGYIVGKQDVAYRRGDHQSGILTPLYFLVNKYLYINKVKIGYINREHQIRYESDDEIYVICTDKNTLCRCNNKGELLWNTNIPLNYTQDIMFDYNDYPSKEFPKNLISISHRNENFGKYMFYKETGDFFGTIEVEKKWKKRKEGKTWKQRISKNFLGK